MFCLWWLDDTYALLAAFGVRGGHHRIGIDEWIFSSNWWRPGVAEEANAMNSHAIMSG